jgi:broad specificity phosphatase PhoE
VSAQHLVRLVRHGRAAAGWNVDPDPDLDDVGRAQAASVAVELAPLGIVSIVSSPLLRCRATAAAFATVTGLPIDIRPEVAEIPSPPDVAMIDRGEWLHQAMQGTWHQLGGEYVVYRDAVVGFVAGTPTGTVIFSHFVAINTVIGACLGDDRLVIRSLDNCSVTTVSIEDGRLVLVEGGDEADTLIR